LKLQEEERERKDNYVPEHSAIETEVIEVDADTKAMLRNMDMGNLPVNVVAVPTLERGRPRRS
jgi:small subunit ribosomal protein S17e